MKMLEDPAPLAPLPKSVRVAVAAQVAIALVIGHDPKEHGAVGTCKASDGKEIKVSEYAYNLVVSEKVRALLAADPGLVVHDVRRHLCGGYSGMIKFVNGLKVDFALELHFNAAENPQAHGCEMLFWHRSEKSRLFASALQGAVVTALQTRDRGIKPIVQGGRGAPFLNRTAMPAVIAEPFFGSNSSEMQKAMDNVDRLAAAYAAALRAIGQMIRKGRQG